MFGKKKATGAGGIAPSARRHAMFEHDRYYFHEWLAYALALVTFVSGLGLIVIGVITTQNFWYGIILYFSPHRDSTSFQQGAHIFGYLAGSVGVLFLFTLIFDTGRHYANRQARRGHESLGMMRSMPSHGGDFKLLAFQESQNFLPYILFGIDLFTTMGGFLRWLDTPISIKTLEATITTGEVLVIALIFAIIVFYIGPTFLIKSFHFLAHGNEERYEKRAVTIISGLPGLPSGNKRIVGGSSSSSHGPVSSIPAGNKVPAGLPSPKASTGTHIPQPMQPLQQNPARKAVNLAAEEYDDYRL